MDTRDELNRQYLQLSRQLKEELAKLEENYQQVEKIVGNSIQFTPYQRQIYHKWMEQLDTVKKLGEQLEVIVKKEEIAKKG